MGSYTKPLSLIIPAFAGTGLLFTIDSFSVSSVLSVADRKAASHGDLYGICPPFCVTVRITYSYIVFRMWYVVCGIENIIIYDLLITIYYFSFLPRNQRNPWLI